MSVVLLSRDLMDLGRVRAVVPDAVQVRSVDDPALAHADLILLDLASGVEAASVVAVGPPVVAYGAHVDGEALDEARAAGCREALPRSVVFRRLPDLV